MHLGLIANLNRKGAAEAIDALVRWVDEHGYQLSVCEELASLVGSNPNLVSRKELAGLVDLLVAMGGDCTILSAARSVGRKNTPLLGVNLGSLGFLTQLTPQQMIPALENYISGNYGFDERMVLEAEINSAGPAKSLYALNEIVLDNGPVSRVLDINLKINSEDVVTYVADGLIISTATGSTAYNLAVGGPIVHPGVDAMIVSPIAAFSLTTRPMIIPSHDTLELGVLTEGRSAVLTLDGQVSVDLASRDRVTISQAEFTNRFVVFPDTSYYELLRNKLHWGLGPKG